jgi:glycosyltransferase involved in cell wall biosynthesis
MKILLVSQYFWPENFRINDLVLGLIERGHRVTVLTGKPNYPSGRFFPGYGLVRGHAENYYGADVRRVPLLPRGSGGAVRLFLNYASFAVAATILGPFLCRDEYDAILVYEPSPITVGLPALWLKRLRGVPVFFWVQDLWPESLSATGAVRSAWVLRWAEKLVRFVYKGCDRILAQSRAFFQPIQALGVEPARILYFPNSAEPLYRPVKSSPANRAQAGVPNGFVVMFAGNVGAAQDFETIIQAAERLKSHADVHWVIVGDGRMRSWVEEQVRARALSSNFHLLGSHSIEAMPHFFAMADAMLVTLKKDPIFALTIPSKVQSYLACGRPIIAALDGEGAQVVREAGAGLTVPAEDAAALADVVLAMSRMDRAQREAMGSRGRSYFERNFQREMLLERLEGWLREACGRGLACAS